MATATASIPLVAAWSQHGKSQRLVFERDGGLGRPAFDSQRMFPGVQRADCKLAVIRQEFGRLVVPIAGAPVLKGVNRWKLAASGFSVTLYGDGRAGLQIYGEGLRAGIPPFAPSTDVVRPEGEAGNSTNRGRGRREGWMHRAEV